MPKNKEELIADMFGGDINTAYAEPVKKEEIEDDMFSFAEEIKPEKVVEDKPTVETIEVTDEFTAYVTAELEKTNIKNIKKLIEFDPEAYPTFEEVMYMKYKHKDLFVLDVGSPLDQILLSAPINKYFITTLKLPDYYNFLELYGPVKDNKTKYFEYILEKCVLHPKLSKTDIAVLEGGVGEIITGTIIKNSKFDTDFEVKRI